MEVKVRRIKKGDVVAMQKSQSGYVASPAEEKGYYITLGYTSAFVPDSVFKEARSNGDAVLETE